MNAIAKTSLLKKLYFDPSVEVEDIRLNARHRLENFRWKKWLIGVVVCFLLMGVCDVFAILLKLVVNNGEGRFPAYEGPVWKGFFWMLMMVLREELIFRLPARRNLLNLFLGLCIFAWYLVYKTRGWFGEVFGNEAIDLQILTALLGVIVAFPLLKVFYKKKYMWVWWTLSILVFGYLHLVNYQSWNPLQNGWYATVIVMPQLLTGIVFLISRLKLGFCTTVLLHFIGNTSLEVFSWIVPPF